MAICISFLLLSSALSAEYRTIERVSISSNGEQANIVSTDAAISASGRFVAFVSYASNLVADDTNNTADIFVHDRQTGTTERVSLTNSGEEVVSASGLEAELGTVDISDDGRYVLFKFWGDLVPGNGFGLPDFFVHDRELHTTQRITVSSSGEPGNSLSASYYASISGDGRYVAFESASTNLIPGGTSQFGIFVRDLQMQTTELVSISNIGEEGNDSSRHPDISDDGRYVVFKSMATNLIPEFVPDGIYVHDRVTGINELVNVSSDGTPGNVSDYDPVISGNGRFVAFKSESTNLVAGDTNASEDVFVHDRDTGITERVSVSSTEEQAVNGSSYKIAISADGRFVTFDSGGNLVPGVSGGIFVRDRQVGSTELVNVASDGGEGNYWSRGPSISDDGLFIAFESQADNLVPNDTNSEWDIFVASVAPSLSPTRPTNLIVTATSTTTIDLNWTDNSSDETNFRIERRNSGTEWTQVAVIDQNITIYIDSDLICNKRYEYRVRAYRDNLFSLYSNIADATTQACPPPNAPNNLTATPLSQETIKLAWTDNASDETHFYIEHSPDGTNNWAVIFGFATPNMTAITHLDLTCGTSHYYRVRVYRLNDNQFSSYSNVANATTLACPPLNAPSDLIASTLSGTRIRLTWADNSTDETEFRVERSPDDTSNWTQITSTGQQNITTYSDTNLSCGTEYYYRVYAYRALGSTASAYSNTISATTWPCPPEPIQNYFATHTPTLTWARITWAILGYEIEVADNPDFEDAQTYSSTTLEVTTNPLANGQYYWRVRGVSINDKGAWSIKDIVVIDAP